MTITDEKLDKVITKLDRIIALMEQEGAVNQQVYIDSNGMVRLTTSQAEDELKESIDKLLSKLEHQDDLANVYRAHGLTPPWLHSSLPPKPPRTPVEFKDHYWEEIRKLLEEYCTQKPDRFHEIISIIERSVRS